MLPSDSQITVEIERLGILQKIFHDFLFFWVCDLCFNTVFVLLDFLRVVFNTNFRLFHA